MGLSRLDMKLLLATVVLRLANLVLSENMVDMSAFSDAAVEPIAPPDFSQCFYVPPQCPNQNITFWHYTRETKDKPFEVTMENYKNAPFKDNVPFVVLIHGYTGWKDYAPNPELRAALFSKGEFNIISVDYNPIAREPCYVQAAYNVRTVANCSSRLLLEMMKGVPQIISNDNLHIIGFSLGAQTAGNIGSFFKSLGGFTAKYITGLDPALPLFDSILVTADSRLSEDDAEFLDVYHTDSGNKGILRPAGKVDFYLNNGFDQPGCASNNSCDHYRAVVYYAESINESSKGFYGAACSLSLFSYVTGSPVCQAPRGENTSVLSGYYIPHSSRGTYQVLTNSTAPFALGKNPPTSSRSNSIFG